MDEELCALIKWRYECLLNAVLGKKSPDKDQAEMDRLQTNAEKLRTTSPVDWKKQKRPLEDPEKNDIEPKRKKRMNRLTKELEVDMKYPKYLTRCDRRRQADPVQQSNLATSAQVVSG